MINKHDYKILGKKIDFNNYVKIYNPSTNNILGEVPALNREQVNQIYQFAHCSQKKWKLKTISERATFLKKWAKLIDKNKELIAKTIIQEIAKSYQDSIIEIERTLEYIKYTIEQMYRIDLSAASSEQFYQGERNKLAISKHEPVGVVLVISPFNYPVNLSISKIAPAIISGNTVVFKPATQGSITATKLIKLLEETGIDQGVVNLVTGKGREIGDYLVQHELINFVNFTGGTETGIKISEQLKLVPQVMELGGKDAAIILDDVDDLESIAKNIISGAFNYSGQRCTAIKRVLVSKKHKSKVDELLLKEINTLKVGLPQNNCDIVPVIDQNSVNFLKSLLKELNSNAKILCGNKVEGNLFYPTLVTNVERTDSLAIKEQFGPILPIITYDSIDEAIEIINESEYGLQATIYGSNINNLFKIAQKLDVGTVNFNDKSARGPDNFPFVGHKKSGLGVQGIKESIKSMTRIKTIVINIK